MEPDISPNAPQLLLFLKSSKQLQLAHEELSEVSNLALSKFYQLLHDCSDDRRLQHFPKSDRLPYFEAEHDLLMLQRSRSRHSDRHHGQILLCVRVEQYGDMESLQIYEV
jgi:hypothetical protein